MRTVQPTGLEPGARWSKIATYVSLNEADGGLLQDSGRLRLLVRKRSKKLD